MAIVVDEPIINSPFAEPTEHWALRGGKSERIPTRRPSGYMPGLRTRGGAGGTLLEEAFVELPLVNEIRERVGRWRAAGYPGASRTTLELLRHWAGRGQDNHPLFFCQLEAAETAIWLVEGAATDTGGLPLVEQQQEAYTRHCLKMATGSGKTVVMAMLIAWSVLNKARQPQDRRYSDAVLVLCPNLTVKERLAVLRPADPENYYEAFDLVAAGLRSALLGAKVMVTNWHVMAMPDDSRRRGIVQRGRPSAAAFANLALRSDLGAKSNILVLNDEAHHAWHDVAGIGSTEITPFLTVKPCPATLKSHLSNAVCDSGWEATVARALDESTLVRAWAKNARLGLEIPYSHQGVAHQFTPDFLVQLQAPAGAAEAVGEHVLVEVKGLERAQDRSKDVGAARWVAAVNHWGRLGRWRYAKIHSPHDLASVLGVAGAD